MNAFADLAAFVFALSIAVGALFFLVIAQLTNARWFIVFRRIAEAVAATLPIFLVLFVPVALSLSALYPWAGAATSLGSSAAAKGHDAEWIVHQRAWNNAPFFLVRSYVYLTTWSILAFMLRRSTSVRSRRTLSAAALPILAITLTLAAFDWIMPLQIDWVSDIFGVYLFAGSLAGAMSAITLFAYAAWRSNILPSDVGAPHFHALGRVLLMSVIFWAYIGLCQFLLMWIADLPHEITFYDQRTVHGWTAVTVVLGLAHFAIPFLVLLSRKLKENPRALAVVAGWLLVAHAIDTYWLVVPTRGASPRPFDVVPFIAVAALSFAFGIWRFRAGTPFPERDPSLAQSLRYRSL